MYVKLFGTIITSSIWGEDATTCKVWITMLAMADAEGIVAASTAGLARMSAVTLPETIKALKVLGEPDLDSRSPEYGGRRVDKVDGGWLLLNYEKYREIKTAKQLRDASRQRRIYAEAKRDLATSPPEAEAEAEAEVTTTTDSSPGKVVVEVHSGTPPEEFLEQTKAKGNAALGRREILALKIQMVFAYWAALFGKTRSRLDTKRGTRIRSRLVETVEADDVSEILHALDGARTDAWTIGTAPKSTKAFDGIETILRDRGQVEKFWEMVPAAVRCAEHPFVQSFMEANTPPGENHANQVER